MMDDNFLQWLDEHIAFAALRHKGIDDIFSNTKLAWRHRLSTLQEVRHQYLATQQIQTPGSLIDTDATLTADEAAHAEELAGMDDEAARGLNAFMCGKG